MGWPRTSQGCTWRGMRGSDSPAIFSPGRGTGNSRAWNADEGGREGEGKVCGGVVAG